MELYDYRYCYLNVDSKGREIFNPCCGMREPSITCLSCVFYEVCYGHITDTLPELFDDFDDL